MNAMETQAAGLADLLAEAAWARRLARSLVRDQDDAEDILQETWLSALRHPPARNRPLRPWLAHVLRNRSINHRTADRRRAAREDAAANTDTDKAVPSPEALLERMQAQRLLAELVTALEEPYRTTVLLHYYEGLSSAQAAQRLGVPAGTVRWRLKTALDQLRQALDQRTGGERQRWRLALLPLGMAPSRRGRAAVLGAGAMAAIVGLVLVAVGVFTGSRDETADQRARFEGAISAGAAFTSGRPPAHEGGPASELRALAAAASTCQAEVERLRKEVAAAEPEALRTITHEKLFARGAPNPAAEKEIAPILARIMKGDYPTAPAYTLECRTWVCKVAVAFTPEEATRERVNAWMRPLQHDLDMSARTMGVGFHTAPSVKDPVAGHKIHRQDIHLRLKSPSGKAVQGLRKPTMIVSFGPPPADEKSCRLEASALKTRLAAAQADIEEDMGPVQRFAKSTHNPSLTAEVNADIRRIFGDEPERPAAECRDLVCKLSAPATNRSWRETLKKDRELMRKHKGGAFGPEIHLRMKPAEQLTAERWLQTQLDAFLRTPAIDACANKHAATGHLSVSLKVPATGQENEDGVVDRLRLRLSGPLEDTPLATCVAEAATRTLLTTVPPAPIVSGSVVERVQFPRTTNSP